MGLLVAVFLIIEARRYRFFDFWRIRAHILELNFFGPILRGQGVRVDNGWNEILYQDYRSPSLHISFFDALGRRLRRNYGWIFTIQVTAYAGKLFIHPVPIGSIEDLWARATIGPVSGQLILLAGLLFHASWIIIAIVTLYSRRGAGRVRVVESVTRFLSWRPADWLEQGSYGVRNMEMDGSACQVINSEFVGCRREHETSSTFALFAQEERPSIVAPRPRTTDGQCRLASLVRADEAADQRKRHEAGAEQHPEEDQRTILEPSPGTALEQFEQAIACQVKHDR